MSHTVILATAGYDHTIRFWEATGMCHRTIEYKDSQVNQLAITPDKHFLAVAGNPNVRLFEINSKTTSPILSFDGHTGNVTAVGFQSDRKWMYTGSEDGTVKIWDIRAPGFQQNYRAPSKAPINTVALHPNQAELICGDDKGNILVWDLTANSCSYQIRQADGKIPIRSISIASDASIVTAATNKGRLVVWRLAAASQRMKAVHKIDAHVTYCLKCLLSPAVNLLATTSSDKTIKIWDVTKGFALLKVLTGHGAWVWDCAFSADSKYLLTGTVPCDISHLHSGSSDKTAKLWDIDKGNAILNYKGHRKAVTAVALNDISVG